MARTLCMLSLPRPTPLLLLHLLPLPLLHQPLHLHLPPSKLSNTAGACCTGMRTKATLTRGFSFDESVGVSRRT